ncbi:IclR family transcriptional regulator, partial [Parvibaculum sp.]|uniref:IclR family transcriptional regulator n=1 Tax=Parvibaculum sp. TaxID=2024848 RepID=UPI003C74828E
MIGESMKTKMPSRKEPSAPPAEASAEPAKKKVSSDRNFVTALARGLNVLSSYRNGDTWLGNSEIAERTGLPKPTVTRLTQTLATLGYLHTSPHRRQFRLGTAVLTLGFAALSEVDLIRVARAHMQTLANECNTYVSMSTRENLHMIHVESARTNRSMVTLRLDIGSRVPLATTSSGKAYLASIPSGERQQIMERLAQKYGDDWKPIRDKIQKAAAEMKEHGFCVSTGGWQSEINAVATTVVMPSDGRVFAVTCGGPSNLFTAKRLATEVGPKLLLAARMIQED